MDRQTTCDSKTALCTVVHCAENYASILYCFQVITSYFSKVAYFNLPHLHMAPCWGWPSQPGLSLSQAWKQSNLLLQSQSHHENSVIYIWSYRG